MNLYHEQLLGKIVIRKMIGNTTLLTRSANTFTCDVKRTSSCRSVTRTDCKQITWNECREVPIPR